MIEEPDKKTLDTAVGKMIEEPERTREEPDEKNVGYSSRKTITDATVKKLELEYIIISGEQILMG